MSAPDLLLRDSRRMLVQYRAGSPGLRPAKETGVHSKRPVTPWENLPTKK